MRVDTQMNREWATRCTAFALAPIADAERGGSSEADGAADPGAGCARPQLRWRGAGVVVMVRDWDRDWYSPRVIR